MPDFTFSVDFSVYENGRKKPEYTLESDIAGEISLADLLEFTKSTLIITADTVLREEQDLGFDKKPVVVVDGRQGKPVIDVNPFGKIEFVSKANMNEILLATYQSILDKSPVRTGQYKSSNYVFLNGKQVATDITSLQSWLNTNPDFQERDLIRFVNIQPYARKLERLGIRAGTEGSTIGRRRTGSSRDKHKAAMGHTVLIPNGSYFLAARSIRARFKQNSIIQFSFIPGSVLGIIGSFKRAKKTRPYLYPSITISVQQAGIT